MNSEHRADFERFARAEMDGLLRYAVMLTGERELARDLVQDVLVKAYERWPRISGLEQRRAYVRTMVTNSFLSWRRRWLVRNVVSSDELRPPPLEDHSTRIVDRDDVAHRLSSLSRRQRAVLVLRYYEQLTDAEIADVLGCAVGTVRSNVSRALAILRLPDGDPDADADPDRQARAPGVRRHRDPISSTDTFIKERLA